MQTKTFLVQKYSMFRRVKTPKTIFFPAKQVNNGMYGKINSDFSSTTKGFAFEWSISPKEETDLKLKEFERENISHSWNEQPQTDA